MMKNTHTFTMTARFNKKCTKADALREIRDSGEIFADEHYCSFIDYNDRGTAITPETFKVKSVR